MHARIVSGAAALLTRNGLDWTAKYPDVAAAIGALNCRQAYVDGELCAVLADGTTSFSALQGHGDAPAELVYFTFDLLHEICTTQKEVEIRCFLRGSRTRSGRP